jgi:hypothetical protein
MTKKRPIDWSVRVKPDAGYQPITDSLLVSRTSPKAYAVR